MSDLVIECWPDEIPDTSPGELPNELREELQGHPYLLDVVFDHPLIIRSDTHEQIQERETKAKELFEKVNSEYENNVIRYEEGILNSAKRMGDLLRLAKRVVPHGSWESYLRAHFRPSHRLANRYMEISRKWNHPRIELARADGKPPTSIQGFYAIINYKQPENIDPFNLTPEQEYKENIEGIKSQFTEFLSTLDPAEFEILVDYFPDYLEDIYKNITITISKD